MTHTRSARQDMMRLAGQPQHQIPGNGAKYGRVQINKMRQGWLKDVVNDGKAL